MHRDAPDAAKDGSFNLLQKIFSKWIISQNEIEVNKKKNIWKQRLVGWFVISISHISISTLHQPPHRIAHSIPQLHGDWCGFTSDELFILHPPKFNIAPEKWWLEDDPFLLERPIFRGYVKFAGCIRIPPGKDRWPSPLACIGLSSPLIKSTFWELRHLLSLQCIAIITANWHRPSFNKEFENNPELRLQCSVQYIS